MSFFLVTDKDKLTAEEPTVAAPGETHHTFEGAEGASHMEKVDWRPPCGAHAF